MPASLIYYYIGTRGASWFFPRSDFSGAYFTRCFNIPWIATCGGGWREPRARGVGVARCFSSRELAGVSDPIISVAGYRSYVTIHACVCVWVGKDGNGLGSWPAKMESARRDKFKRAGVDVFVHT